MANVFNRTTMQYEKSVNTPDYPVEDWIINPTFVPDCEAKYMVVDGDNIREMTPEEKAAVDYVEPAPELTAEELIAKAAEVRKQNIKNEIELTYSLTDEIGIIRTALAELLPDNHEVQAWDAVISAAKAKYPK
jgi:hypothetical protein